MTTVAIDIRGVSKVYNPGSNQAVQALDTVSLTINDNEFFTLLGPSGCGKTTLLRLIAGFEQVTGGEIMLFDEEIENLEPSQRPVNTVFQHYALFPHMTVAQNVAFGLERLKKPQAEIDATVERVLSLVKMKELGDRRPNQLSGGQQQRVALARALVTEPKVLLLDEPLGALDKRLRQEMQIELKQIQRAVGITAIFVTHDQEEALTLSDQIAIINDGQVVQIGAPGEIYENPVNRFAASFLGDANFMEGLVENGRVSVEALGPIVTSSALPGSRVTLAVRPEKMRLTALSDTASDGNRVEGSVTQRVFSGTSVTYIVETPAGPMHTFQQNAGDRMFDAEEAVAITWSPDHTVLVED